MDADTQKSQHLKLQAACSNGPWCLLASVTHPVSLADWLSLFWRDDLLDLSWKCDNYGTPFEEELERLEEVFEWLARAGLKFKPKKCFVFQKRISYLGHVVTKEGIAADPGKEELFRTWPNSENSKEVKGFLRLTSYYRRFVLDFSTIAKPLYKLAEAKTEFVWTAQCQLAFDGPGLPD